MPPPPLPPPSLKQVTHYMKVASEHDARDPVVAYWARYHAVQKALTIDKSSPDGKLYIVQLLDWLEKKKKELSANEAVTNDVVAEAHVENYALRLFKYADDADRKGIFNKNTIKAFYTSSLLIDILENFNPISEEFDKMRKYGKWKAAYVHNCLKNGEVPTSGEQQPPGDYNEEDDAEEWSVGPAQQPAAPAEQPPPPAPTTTLSTISTSITAQKYTKFASSALNFDDVPTAILNLKKALHLLEHGTELPAE